MSFLVYVFYVNYNIFCLYIHKNISTGRLDRYLSTIQKNKKKYEEKERETNKNLFSIGNSLKKIDHLSSYNWFSFFLKDKLY